MKFGSLDLRLPEGASASIDDVEVIVGSAHDHRDDAPAEGTPHVILTGKVVWGSVDIRGPRKIVPAAAGRPRAAPTPVSDYFTVPRSARRTAPGRPRTRSRTSPASRPVSAQV